MLSSTQKPKGLLIYLFTYSQLSLFAFDRAALCVHVRNRPKRIATSDDGSVTKVCSNITKSLSLFLSERFSCCI